MDVMYCLTLTPSSAQHQLYASQKTCLSLKERVDSQRRDSLTLSVSASVKENEIKIHQDDEIKDLRRQLEYETNKVKDQIEQMKLLEAELNEVKLWKEKILEEQTQLTPSKRMQNEHKEQIELLTLKLEAAEFASKTRGESTDGSTRKRAEHLKLELENVRAKYAELTIRLAETDNADDVSKQQKHKKMMEDMDQAIQLAFQTALDSVEDEWKEKYQTIEQQLQEAIKYKETVNYERGEAVDGLKEATSEEQQHFKEELTDQLTAELTEKITMQLTEELTGKIEKRLRKKYKKLQRELESKAHSDEDNQQMLQAEIEKIKEQYESEYANKMKELQQQNDEQLKKQKERMRKLVRALLEREAKENKKSSKSNKSTNGGSNTGDQKLEERRKETEMNANNSDEEIVTTSAVSSLGKKRRSQSGVTPFRVLDTQIVMSWDSRNNDA
eukprot:scaffold5837_cov76-Cyclotella_meneghiniana.AAC.14